MEMIHNFLLDKCVLQVTKYACDLVEKKNQIIVMYKIGLLYTT